MPSQQQAIIGDEFLKVLSLFPKRQLSTIKFQESKFFKIYDSLRCPLCRQLFRNPVYLLCSHRYCRQCIEKNIELNQKKICPVCKSGSNTKREFKNDRSLTNLIEYVFSGRKKFAEDTAQIEKISTRTEEQLNNKYSRLVRNQSFPPEQQQQKNSKKRVKFNQILPNQQQITERKSRRRKSNCRFLQKTKSVEEFSKTQQIQNDNNISITANSKISSTLILKQQALTSKVIPIDLQNLSINESKIKTQEQKQLAKQRIKRGRKKQIPTIEVQSNSENQAHEIKQLMELQDKQGPALIKNLSLTSNSKKPEKSEKSQGQTDIRLESFEKQRQILKQEFGDNYMLSLIKLPVLDFMIEIKLQKHPECFITASLPCKSVQLSSKVKIHHVYIFLSKMLNIPIQNVLLYVNGEEIISLPYNTHKSKLLCQINQQIWKTSASIQFFDMKQILSSLQDRIERKYKQNSLRENIPKKKLFQSIQFDRQLKNKEPKKRGRGRIKKYQEKQNLSDYKDDFKRVFYYRMILE